MFIAQIIYYALFFLTLTPEMEAVAPFANGFRSPETANTPKSGPGDCKSSWWCSSSQESSIVWLLIKHTHYTKAYKQENTA